MEAQVSRAVLAEETGWVSRVIPGTGRAVNVIHNGLLIEAGDGQLQLSASDGSTSSTTTLEATVDAPGSAVISGRLFANIAGSLPQKPVAIKLNGTRLELACGRSEFAFPTSPLEEYPKLPDQPDQIGSLAGSEFSDAVWQVAFAAAKEDALPVLTGIQLKCTDTHITMIATDRYRLAVKKVPWTGTAREPFLLKAKTLSEFSKPVSPNPVVLSLDPGTTLFGVGTGTRRSTMQMLDGTAYPDVERLMPATGTVTVTFDVAELVDAVKRVKLVMSERANQPIRLTFGNEEILLAAGGGSDSTGAEAVDATIAGDRTVVAFNPEYLIDGLTALAGGTGRFQLNNPAKPVLLDSPEDESYRHVLMPVRLDA